MMMMMMMMMIGVNITRAFGEHRHSQGISVPIGVFRDTYLGRQVVSRPGGPRAGMGSPESLGERCELP